MRLNKELVYCLRFVYLFPAYRFNLQPISGFNITDHSTRTPIFFVHPPLQIFSSVVLLARQLHLEKPGYTRNSTHFNELSYSYVTAIYPS